MPRALRVSLGRVEAPEPQCGKSQRDSSIQASGKGDAPAAGAQMPGYQSSQAHCGLFGPKERTRFLPPPHPTLL